MAEAKFTFASMIHRGFLAGQDAALEVRVAVAGKEPIVRPVPMMTSGDVIGVPSRQVIRTTPGNGVLDAEPNYLAAIEFDAPDLPWMFSRKTAVGPVLPWITLAVIDVTELAADPLSASPIGSQLTIEAAQLPNPAHSWMFAHGQLLDADTVPSDPARSLSRLVGARKLEPNRRYLACVVPVFKAGATAGLGVDPGDGRASMDLAWDPQGADTTLPVYYFWRFGTGPSGDFESLVRRLHGVPLPPGLGTRQLLLDYPMSGLPAPEADGASVELQVALRPPRSEVDEIRPQTGTGYLEALKARLVDAGYDIRLLAGPDAPPPTVGPPVYGQLAVGENARVANLETLAPPWVQEANLDPRLRVAAGLGAEVVRRNQDRYVEEAWRQVGEVNAANNLRRRAEFSLAASQTLHRRWLSRLAAGDLVTSTAPVHSRVYLDQGLTITGRLRKSPLPPAVSSIEYRRLTRARGRLSAALTWHAAVAPEVLASRSAEAHPLKLAANLDTIDTVEAPSEVWGKAEVSPILKRLVPDLDTAAMTETEAAAQLDALNQPHSFSFASASEAEARADAIEPARVLSAAGMLPVATVVETPEASSAPATGAAAAAAAAVTPFAEIAGLIPVNHLLVEVLAAQPDLVVRDAAGVTVDATAVSAMALSSPAASTISRSVFDELVAGNFTEATPTVRDFSIPTAVTSVLKHEMFEVAAAFIDRQIVEGDAVSPPQAHLDGGFNSIRESIVAALDPKANMKRMVNSRISAISETQAESLDDIMAAPDLSEPTYKGLSDISHDWLLPGIDTLPSDTTTLVESNRTFISAFLVGMNHELARELLWREYPTDQRGTYSRQFWTHLNTGDPADQLDLKTKLHQGSDLKLEQLGMKPGDAKSPLVLVVKGDLVRRYPGVLVTAAKTKANGSTRRLDPSTEIQPDFIARLEPDVMLVGFNRLDADEVRELDADDATAWWFFFAEHFTEPRFGFDTAPEGAPPPFVDWNDASWGNVAVDPAGRLGPDSFSVPPLPKSKPGLTPGINYDWRGKSSAIAWILLQYPFRRGMRAAGLLPPLGGP